MQHFRPIVLPLRQPPGLLRLVVLMTRREVLSKLASFWFFLVATVVCLIAFVYGSGFQQSFATESVLVTTDPLLPLNVMVSVFLGLVLGLRLSTSLSWEREHRTLEVLLIGPVPWSVIIAAKFIVELLVLTAMIAVYLAYLVLAQPLGAGVIGLADIASMAVTPLFVLPVMVAGLLVSAWAATVRSAVVIYLVAIGVLAAFEAVLGILKTMPIEDMSLSSLYLKSGMETVSRFLSPLSPVSQLARAVERLFIQNPVTPVDIASVLALTAGLLAATLFLARARGAQG